MSISTDSPVIKYRFLPSLFVRSEIALEIIVRVDAYTQSGPLYACDATKVKRNESPKIAIWLLVFRAHSSPPKTKPKRYIYVVVMQSYTEVSKRKGFFHAAAAWKRNTNKRPFT